MRLYAMRRHQPGERRTMFVEIALLHPPRLHRIAGEQPLDIVAHANIDQFEQVRRGGIEAVVERSEEHTSELQSLLRTSYAVFCLNKKNKLIPTETAITTHNQT